MYGNHVRQRLLYAADFHLKRIEDEKKKKKNVNEGEKKALTHTRDESKNQHGFLVSSACVCFLARRISSWGLITLLLFRAAKRNGTNFENETKRRAKEKE